MFYSKKLEKILLGIIYVTSFLVVAVPLVVIPESYFPYIVLKTVIMRVLIELAFFSWLVLILRCPEYRPKKTLLFWVLSIFMLVWLVATIFSQSWIKSLWGNYERMGGLFNFLHYYLWWLVLVNTLKNVKHWYRLLGFSLLVSVVMCIYAIGQRLGSTYTLEAGLTRVNGTVGNAAYLAAYLLFHLFIAWYFFAKANVWWKKLLYLAVFALQLVIMTLTSTRGAFVGFSAALVLFGVLALVFKFYREKSVRVFVVFSFLAILAGSLTFIFKDTSFVHDNYYLDRLTNMSIQDNTIQTRLISWQAGLKGFKDYLLTGVGPENYNIVFNRYFTPDFYDYTGDEVWFDRAHNTLVDMASMLGIFGLLNYLAIFLAIFYIFWRFYKKQGYAVHLTVLGLLFVAYFIQNIFVFDSLNSFIPFFMMLGLVDCFDRLNATPSQTVEKKPHRLLALPLYLLLSAVAFTIIQFTVNIPQVAANQYTYRAFVAARAYDYEAFMTNYVKAAATDVVPLDPINLLVQNLSDVTVRNRDKLSLEEINKNYQTAIELAEEGIRLDPKNVYNHYLLAKLYNGFAEITQDGAYLSKALESLQTCKVLSPNNIRIYWVEAQTYIIAGKYDQALESLDLSIALSASIADPYWFKYIIYQQLGDENHMYQYATEAILHNYPFRFQEDIKEMIPHYQATEEYGILERLYLKLLNFEPKNLTYYEQIIKYQALQEEFQKAIDTAKRASEAVPAYSDRAYELYQQLLPRL